MIKSKVVEIQISECTTIQRTVPVWELPVLQVVHPKSSLREISDTLVDRKPPNADTEFARLAKRYHSGKPEDGSPDEVSFVAKVYGAYGIGNAALARAISEATVEVPANLSALLGDLQVSSVGG